MSANEIRTELRKQWGDDSALDLCLQIVDYIAALPVGQREMLTVRTLCEAVNKHAVDSELLQALAILVGSRIGALDAWGLLVDEDDTTHAIDPGTLAEARRAGRLVHPITGEIVSDFEAHVFPFFVPTDRFSGGSQ